MHSQKKVSDSRKDTTMSNVVTLGLGMSLCLIGVKTSSSFIVPILGDLGSISMAVLYFSNSFSNFIVPPILNLFKNERQAMFWTVFEYFFYVLQFAYVIPAVNILWSVVHGIFAAVIWTAEGIYLCGNSTDKDRGKKSGVFWTLYMIGAAVGNIAVYILTRFFTIADSQSPSGWHGSASYIFIFLAIATLFGAIPLGMLKPSPNESNRKFINKTKPQVLMKKMLRMIISPNMVWLLLPMFFVGFEYVFIGSMLTRQVHDTGSVGLMMSLFCIVETIISTPLGLVMDKLGSSFVFATSTVFELLSLITFWYANKTQGGLFYLAFILFSLSDSCYETVIPAIIGKNYTDIESANSTFRLFQYMGSCICYLVAPLFTNKGTKWVTDENLKLELTLCATLCILAAISFVIYVKVYNKIMVVTKVAEKKDEKPTTDSKKGVDHVINEDLEEYSKGANKGILKTNAMPEVKVTISNNEEELH